jgi:hypothetical protein
LNSFIENKKTLIFILFYLVFFPTISKADVVKVLNQSNLPFTDTQNLKLEYRKFIRQTRKQWQNKEAVIYNPVKHRNYYKNKNQFLANQFKLSNQKVLEKYQNTKITEAQKKKLLYALTKAKKYQFAKNGIYYTEEENNIGFCFMKAMMVHFYLLKSGVPADKIKKIFALGQLRSKNKVWSFHVAIAVNLGNDAIIIDPSYSTLLTLKQWTEKVEQLAADKPYSKVKYYLTDARKFLPDSGAYSLDLLHSKKIKNYTQTLLNYLEK